MNRYRVYMYRSTDGWYVYDGIVGWVKDFDTRAKARKYAAMKNGRLKK